MSIEQMRNKLLEWNPEWNVFRFTDEQIAIIYTKERNKVLDEIFKRFSQ